MPLGSDKLCFHWGNDKGHCCQKKMWLSCIFKLYQNTKNLSDILIIILFCSLRISTCIIVIIRLLSTRKHLTPNILLLVRNCCVTNECGSDIGFHCSWARLHYPSLHVPIRAYMKLLLQFMIGYDWKNSFNIFTMQYISVGEIILKFCESKKYNWKKILLKLIK